MTDTRATIRPARSGDAEAIARLITLLGYPSTPEQMRARLMAMAEQDRHATFVAEESSASAETMKSATDGAVVGMAGAFVGRIYEEDVPVGRILALGVDEKLRGQSIGSLLLREAESWMRAQGAGAILVNSGNHRTDAQRFYQAAGYTAKGRSFVKRLEKN